MRAAYLLKRSFACAAIFLVLLAWLPGAVVAARPDPVALRAALDKAADAEGTKLDDYELIDQDGVKFRLSDYFKDGKPLVVSFIYTSCPMVCPLISSAFKKGVEDAKSKFGSKFNVLTIGFDPPSDSPAALKAYGRKLTGDFKAFRLATSDAETIKRLTAQFGFYNLKKDDGTFDHIDMASVVRPDGTIYKQVYSIRTKSDDIKTRLDELITGKAYVGPGASLIDKVKFFCYKYDPYTGKYVPDYAVFAGFIIQFLVLVVIVYAVWGSKLKDYFKGADG